MRVEEALRILNRFSTNHPDWQIKALEETCGKIRIAFIYTGCNSRATHPTKDVRVTHDHVIEIEGLPNEGALIYFVKERWKYAWLHESSEWLCFDTKLIDDPHKDEL